MNKPTKRARPATSDVRLLPAVIGVGAILFVLKAGGLAFSASAATEANPAGSPATAAGPAGSDPLAAINAALPVPPKAPAPSEAPRPADELNPDLAGGGISPAEMDVLTSLADRRNALEQRQRDLDLRANLLAASEKRVDGKIAELKALQARIESLLGQRDAKEVEQLDSLVRVYTAMKPKDAARIFAALDETVRLGVAGRMKPDVMAGIMAALPAEIAQKMTVSLAGRYKLPADISAPGAPAPAPNGTAPANANASAPPPPAAP